MPAIKLKKRTQEYLAEKEREKEAQAILSQPPPAKKVKEEQEEPEKVHSKPKPTFLDAEILYEKRKRTIPVVEQKCADWIADNLEPKEGVTVSLTTLYEYYVDTGLLEGANVVDVPLFNRLVRDKFGKHFGVKESSPLNGLIKEHKPKQKKPKVQGETLNLKMKDIIDEVITAAGNPNKGLRFHTLKQQVASKYPALQVELYPNKLLIALDRGIRYGHIILVKGSGKCGFYRKPGESTAEEDKPKPPKEKSQKKVGENGESTKDEHDKAEEPEKKSRSGGKKSKKKQGSDEAAAEDETEEDKKEENKTQKKKSKKKPKKFSMSRFRSEAEKHSDPRRIEDAFQLAITYMSDPKETSVTKIRKYIEKFYPEADVAANLKKRLEKGEEKGMWQKVQSGNYRLLLAEFNPSYSNDIDDMIGQAIIATHEPKMASAGYIKKYINEYHPDFNIEARPHLFKKALERAVDKLLIWQVSGLGASGSFQLAHSFVPSPTILAGEIEDLEVFDMEDEGKGEVYVVRKTRSGRGGPKSDAPKQRSNR